jgi:CheY-like chemotaxis protein
MGETPAVRAAATPKSILIVEDNEDARRTLHALLMMDGHQVRTAPDGNTGIALAGAALPALAFVDISLPDIDGYEVARRLRAMQTVHRIGLVAVTGFGQEEDQRRAYDAGFDAHLVKPVSVARLQQVILDLSSRVT